MDKFGKEMGKQYLKDQFGGGSKNKDKDGSGGGGGGSGQMSTSQFLKEAREFSKTKGVYVHMNYN
jgi:hypothetical protein